MKKIIFIFILLVLFSCSKDQSISEEKFIKVYEEVLIARESTDDTATGTEKVNEVFAKYHITEPQFRQMFEKLSADNPKRLAEMIDSVRLRTEVDIRKIDSVSKASEMEKDTNSPTQSKK